MPTGKSSPKKPIDFSDNPTALLEEFARFDIAGKKLEGKTIVQILPAVNRGGVERGTYEMARAIIAHGGKAVVISNGGFMESQFRRIGATHHTLAVHSKNPLAWGGIRRKLGKLLDEIAPDLVHIRSRAPAWIALGAARQRRIPVVTTIHSRLRGNNPIKKAYNRIMLKSDFIIVISDYIAQLVLEQFPRLHTRIAVVHRGVDMRHFSPDHTGARRMIQASEKLGLPADRRIIMMPARPTAWKGAEVLIDAAGRIKDRDFLLALVGAADGTREFRDRLTARITSAGLADKVRLTPLTDDMPAALMLAHVAVMPSVTPEPFGRVAIEAQAMRCPVIAFAHGGAMETISHGKTGWLAGPPGDDMALAECLGEALALTAAQRKAMGEAGRRRVGRLFTMEKMCTATIGHYAALLAQKKRPRKSLV